MQCKILAYKSYASVDLLHEDLEHNHMGTWRPIILQVSYATPEYP